jgi:ribonucleoside-triphosphate reductase (formate)
MFENIKKRDGRIVPFDSQKITAAIAKAGNATVNSRKAMHESLP